MPASASPDFLRGIVPSMNTPFLEDGSIDIEGVRRSGEFAVKSGVAGMLILAVAAETGSLKQAEKLAVAQAFLEQVAGRVPVIVGCSSDSQEERVALAGMARGLGAQFILCQAPAGLRGEALVQCMLEVTRAGPPSLMLQDLDFSGPGLPLADIVLLRERVPAFRCLKIEASPAGPKYSAVLEATGGTLHVSGGWAAAQMIEALQRGVHAFMPTAMDPVYTEIHRRFQAGDHAGARALFDRLLPVLAFSNQHIHVSIRFFKQLRHREGLFRTALCRTPVPELDAYQAREAEVNIARVLALQAELQC